MKACGAAICLATHTFLYKSKVDIYEENRTEIICIPIVKAVCGRATIKISDLLCPSLNVLQSHFSFHFTKHLLIKSCIVTEIHCENSREFYRLILRSAFVFVKHFFGSKWVKNR